MVHLRKVASINRYVEKMNEALWVSLSVAVLGLGIELRGISNCLASRRS